MLIRVLLAIDPPFSERLTRLLERPDVLLQAAPEEPDLWAAVGQESFDLLVVERGRIPGPEGESIAALRKLPDRPDIIVFQGREDARFRAAMIGAGALAVLSPYVPENALVLTLRSLLARRREAMVSRWQAERPEGIHRLSDFASSSRPMQILLDLARRLVAADTSLLVLGETGVGKEWIARAIHEESPRNASPFVAVNCAAIPDELLESELFGHEKGAFTGAIRPRRGSFELAHGGTLFLDEIADMSPSLQAKLLRALQERRIQRLGSESSIAVDIRIMAATNRELEASIREGRFRRDLYYRLAVVTLTVPPLRDRREDIPLLVESYLEQFRLQLRRPVTGVRREALQALSEYGWPGNVRELINVMERAVILCQVPEITVADLPEGIARPRGTPPVSSRGGLLPEPEPDWLEKPLATTRRHAVDAAERCYLEAQLARSGGRIGETAARAGLDPRTLYGKMRRLGLRKEDFRRPP